MGAVQLIFCIVLLVFIGLICMYQVMKLNMKDPDRYSLWFLIGCDTVIVLLVILMIWMVISNWSL